MSASRRTYLLTVEISEWLAKLIEAGEDGHELTIVTVEVGVGPHEWGTIMSLIARPLGKNGDKPESTVQEIQRT